MASDPKIDWDNPPEHILQDSDLLLELMRRTYESEHQRKDQITSSLALPTGVVIGAIGALLYFASLLIKAKQDDWATALTVSVCLLLLSLAVAIIGLIAAYWERDYLYVVPPSAIINKVLQLMESRRQEMQGVGNLSSLVESDLKAWLVNHFGESAEDTRKSNENRLDCIRVTKWALAGITIALAASVLPAIVVARSNLAVSYSHTANSGGTVDHGAKGEEPTTTDVATEDSTRETSSEPRATANSAKGE